LDGEFLSGKIIRSALPVCILIRASYILLIVPAKPLDAKKRAADMVTENIIINDLNFFSTILFDKNLTIMLTKHHQKID